MASNTRGEHFKSAEKALKRADFIAALMLFSLGIIAPLADPFSDMVERWRKS